MSCVHLSVTAAIHSNTTGTVAAGRTWRATLTSMWSGRSSNP
jgi:hypothetical protein